MRLLLLVLALLLAPLTARAHCDAMDGPVVSAAKAALSSGDAKAALAWVRAEDEAEVRRAFERTRAVRGTSKAVREVADTWFFETVVRLHRASEGEPYTGLKPAGKIAPAIATMDRALATEDLDMLQTSLDESMNDALQVKFRRVIGAKKHASDDTLAARHYVEAYVELVKFVEAISESGHAKEPHL